MDESVRKAVLGAVPSLRAFAISLSGNADRADDLIEVVDPEEVGASHVGTRVVCIPGREDAALPHVTMVHRRVDGTAVRGGGPVGGEVVADHRASIVDRVRDGPYRVPGPLRGVVERGLLPSTRNRNDDKRSAAP